MTNKETAKRLREIADEIAAARINGFGNRLIDLANELDPTRPLTGTVVWWKRHDYTKWNLGYVADRQYGVVPLNDEIGFDDYYLPWADVEWKPARILADDEVAVKIPPVSEWPDNAGQVLAMYATVTSARVAPLRQIITRDEAERMERER